MKISENFKLNKNQSELEFIDINLEKDNLLFIDPRLIEKNTDKFSKKCNISLELFWGEFIRLIYEKTIQQQANFPKDFQNLMKLN